MVKDKDHYCAFCNRCRRYIISASTSISRFIPFGKIIKFRHLHLSSSMIEPQAAVQRLEKKLSKVLLLEFDQLSPRTFCRQIQFGQWLVLPMVDPGNAHLNSEGGSISTADLLVLTG